MGNTYPNPIWSPKIPDWFLRSLFTNHRTPSCWYGCRVNSVGGGPSDGNVPVAIAAASAKRRVLARCDAVDRAPIGSLA